MADANIYIAGASISPTSVQTGVKYAIAVDVRNVQYVLGTGLMASTYRSQDINSYKSIRGIMKKVCMWLLVVVGAVIDQLLLYASQTAGITLPFTFLVACIVAIWIICNEIISILENIKDMGVAIPGFLLPIVEHVKSQVEDKADINKDSEGE